MPKLIKLTSTNDNVDEDLSPFNKSSNPVSTARKSNTLRSMNIVTGHETVRSSAPSDERSKKASHRFTKLGSKTFVGHDGGDSSRKNASPLDQISHSHVSDAGSPMPKAANMVLQLQRLKDYKDGILKTNADEFKNKFGVGEGEAGNTTLRQYAELKSIFDGRDFRKERKNMLAEVDNLTSSNKVSQLALKGNYVLEKARNQRKGQSLIDDVLEDPGKFKMNCLNDYLNNYSEKLARNNDEDPSNIMIDKKEFYEMAKNVNADFLNPVVQVQEIKEKIRTLEAIDAKLQTQKENRSHVKLRSEKEEEQKFIKDLK